MNATPAQILEAVLVAQSLFNAYNVAGVWPIYTSSMPDNPDQCAAIYDTTGEVITRLLASGKNLQKFGIQLKTRSTDYGAALSKLVDVTNYSQTVRMHSLTVVGNLYTVDTIVQSSSVISMGQDERRRACCSVNFLLIVIGS